MKSPTQLYDLPILGFGSFCVESLSAHVNRLARRHHLTTYTLLSEVIYVYLYQIQGQTQHTKPYRLTGTWWNANAVTINAANKMTGQWVHALSVTTDNSDIRCLTLYQFQDVLPYRKLIREFAAWCPNCYDEDQPEQAYNRLIWQVECLTICSKHLRHLVSQCLGCSQQFPTMGPHNIEGFCPNCGVWLGNLRLYGETSTDTTELEEQQNFCMAVGEMIASIPHLSTKPCRENISLFVKRCINELPGGNAKAFADLLGMHHRSLYEIRDNTQLPRLQTLLRICCLLNTSPLEVVTIENVDRIPTNLANISYLPGPKRRLRNLDRTRIKAFLLDKLA